MSIFEDAFNRPDENPLSNGGAWGPVGGAAELVVTAGYATGHGTSRLTAAWTNDNQACSVMVRDCGAGDSGMYVYLRQSADGTQSYSFWVNPFLDQCSITRRIGDVDTVLLTIPGGSIPEGTTLDFDVMGDVLHAYRNGLLLMSFTDPTPLTGGGPGLRIRSLTTAHISHFVAYGITEVASGPLPLSDAAPVAAPSRFATPLFTDEFNRTQNPLVAPWTLYGGTQAWKANGTQAVPVGTGQTQSLMYWNGAPNGNHWIRARLASLVSLAQDGLVLRLDAAATKFYLAHVSYSSLGGGGYYVQLFKFRGPGNYIGLASGAPIGPFVEGDILGFEVWGNALQVYCNDRLRALLGDKDQPVLSGGTCGIWAQGGTSSVLPAFDSLSIGNTINGAPLS